MGDLDMKELRRLASAASPGPWRAEDTNGALLSKVVVSTFSGSNGSTCVIGACAGPDREANAGLIAAANPTTVLALIDRLERAEDALRALTGEARHG